jgi:hypothetical protein
MIIAHQYSLIRRQEPLCPLEQNAQGGLQDIWSAIHVKYQEAIDTGGKRLDSRQRAFEELQGTRTRVMNKQFARVDELRQQRA